jgi:hypothetical protein
MNVLTPASPLVYQISFVNCNTRLLAAVFQPHFLTIQKSSSWPCNLQSLLQSFPLSLKLGCDVAVAGDEALEPLAGEVSLAVGVEMGLVFVMSCVWAGVCVLILMITVMSLEGVVVCVPIALVVVVGGEERVVSLLAPLLVMALKVCF